MITPVPLTSPPSGSGRAVAVAGGVVALLALAACSGGSTPAPSASASSPSAASPTPTPTPTIARSLLSGRLGAHDGPVLVVKMDNTPKSNPHAGIKYADVVYLEQVEGGLSRYAVVFSSQIPKMVGPVRSARISDIELLRQYGKIAFAYSGAQSKMLPVLKAADLFNVSDDTGGLGYRRDNSRWSAPDNLFADPKILFKRAPAAAHAVNVGFTFGDAVPAGGRPVTSVTASYPATRATFTWSKADGRWLAAMNGTRAMASEGGQLGGTTVIIQYVRVTRSIYHDVNNNYTPLLTSIGTGNALILRNGQAYNATWSRASATSGTHWLVNGQDFPLAAGQIWVLLINKTTPATLK
jgi:Protein of unknown function (DUF3048) N-terminal domain/Protein of unknown function (DUF3048) C-terminal domain